MNQNKLKIQLLSPLYLASAAISLPLLWLISLSFRVYMLRLAQASWRRRVLVLRVLAKHGAQDLGLTLLVAMAVPATIAGGLAHSTIAAASGAVFGFLCFTLIPLMLPMPSREMGDAAATGNRFI